MKTLTAITSRIRQWSWSSPTLVAAACCMALAGCHRTQVPSTAPELTAAGDRDTAGFQEALSIARDRYPDATAIDIAFDEEQGRDMFRVSLWESNQLREVYVDPRTRAIMKESIEEPSSEQSRAILQAAEKGTKLETAIDRALAEHPAKEVQEVGLQVDEAQLVIGVQTKNQDGTFDWAYDSDTGKVLKREKQGMFRR